MELPGTRHAHKPSRPGWGDIASKKSSKEGESDLNGMWLRFGAASLLDCFPPNSKALNLLY
jgi:hypothetical protein